MNNPAIPGASIMPVDANDILNFLKTARAVAGQVLNWEPVEKRVLTEQFHRSTGNLPPGISGSDYVGEQGAKGPIFNPMYDTQMDPAIDAARQANKARVGVKYPVPGVSGLQTLIDLIRSNKEFDNTQNSRAPENRPPDYLLKYSALRDSLY